MAEQDIQRALDGITSSASLLKAFSTDEISETAQQELAFAAALIGSLRQQLAEAREMEFNRGYVLACCNVMNLHGDEVVAFDVLSQLGLSQAEVQAFDLTEYDEKALRHIETARGDDLPYRRALSHPDREGERG